MGFIEGTTRLKSVVADYDFATDGGAAGTITLRGDNSIPAGSVIVSGFVDVSSACLSGSGTIAMTVESAGDIVAAAGQASWTAGRKTVIPVATGATSVKTTVARSVVITIATAAYTAGAFRVTLFYK